MVKSKQGYWSTQRKGLPAHNWQCSDWRLHPAPYTRRCLRCGLEHKYFNKKHFYRRPGEEWVVSKYTPTCPGSILPLLEDPHDEGRLSQNPEDVLFERRAEQAAREAENLRLLLLSLSFPPRRFQEVRAASSQG